MRKKKIESTRTLLSELDIAKSENEGSSVSPTSSTRSAFLDEQATKVQAVGKGFIARKKFKARKEVIINIQARKQILNLKRQVKSILIIQRMVRAHQSKKRKLKTIIM